jgi:hypothetical protein
MKSVNANATSIKPKRFIHRGVVAVAALYFDFDLNDLVNTRRTILSLWKPGAKVYQLKNGLLIRFAQTRMIDCRQAPGLPLTAQDKLLMAAPLSRDELAALQPPDNCAIFSRQGEIVIEPLNENGLAAPESWIDLSQFALIKTYPLAAPPSKPVAAVAVGAIDVREKLSLQARKPSEMAELIRAFNNSSGNASGANTRARQESIADRLREFFL